MKAYCQFFHESTGYVPGSIPPRFDDKYIKPIEMIGSDGVFILDARRSLHNMIEDCKEQIKRHIKSKYIVGFEIRRANSFMEDGRVIYSTVKQFR